MQSRDSCFPPIGEVYYETSVSPTTNSLHPERANRPAPPYCNSPADEYILPPGRETDQLTIQPQKPASPTPTRKQKAITLYDEDNYCLANPDDRRTEWAGVLKPDHDKDKSKHTKKEKTEKSLKKRNVIMGVFISIVLLGGVGVIALRVIGGQPSKRAETNGTPATGSTYEISATSIRSTNNSSIPPGSTPSIYGKPKYYSTNGIFELFPSQTVLNKCCSKTEEVSESPFAYTPESICQGGQNYSSQNLIDHLADDIRNLNANSGPSGIQLCLDQVVYYFQVICNNTDYGATDSGLGICSLYRKEDCGDFDDDDFDSANMCCICGGGSRRKSNNR